MKILLAAVNAKYIHTNPAVRCLKYCAGNMEKDTEIAEYTINQRTEQILADIYSRKPDVLMFSCYIWNMEIISTLIRDFALLCPEVPVWAGGPEVSYDAEEELLRFPELSGILAGEGEKTYRCLAACLSEWNGEDHSGGKQFLARKLADIRGLVWRDPLDGKIVRNLPAETPDMDEIPFLYPDLSELENRIPYYETSRGCPFSCSYCLSSLEKVRFRKTALVEKDLQRFLDAGVPQVKFVDRTFNCSHAHAMAIWKYIAEHDNGITNFHFEIAADLLTEEEISMLGSLRPGQVQLEIGVQSTNPLTIRKIDRVMDISHLRETVRKLHQKRNIHLHLDLIAGLPEEDYASFTQSFDDVFSMHPDQLQMGFLKLLKGSGMYREAGKYGIVCREEPPYEVLFTDRISYEEIQKLKAVEEMLNMYSNSHQFDHTVSRLLEKEPSPFTLFHDLAEYYKRCGFVGKEHSRLGRLDILHDYAVQKDPADREWYEELLILDLYLRENSRSRPEWAPLRREGKVRFREFYSREAEHPVKLLGYEGYDGKQLEHMTHAEIFFHDVLHTGQEGPWYVIFDYRHPDPLSGNARTLVF